MIYGCTTEAARCHRSISLEAAAAPILHSAKTTRARVGAVEKQAAREGGLQRPRKRR